MPNPINLKQIFIKKWIMGLNPITFSNTNMNFLERKNAIKAASDLAMATTRNGATRWSRAIIAKSIQAPPEAKLRRKTMLRKIGRKVARRHTHTSRSRSVARSVAKRLVHKRTKLLRSLVPGGEFMKDEALLIDEALDYISFLRVQVDGMRFLANCK
ncbi:transcription factor IBH1-like 1 [Cucurbita pepo subsp. pepo]|uniref:transcription factor IBH1-like 1 n=1 Tax=Cucurbita pepo subsp. pepo TaxID=3664 RepID=UPI000C9D61B0|nr:transcription factor IBH1-like 1 [Cucurbita pepo subsp. pepo]